MFVPNAETHRFEANCTAAFELFPSQASSFSFLGRPAEF